jgi:hypothetical protein
MKIYCKWYFTLESEIFFKTFTFILARWPIIEKINHIDLHHTKHVKILKKLYI